MFLKLYFFFLKNKNFTYYIHDVPLIIGVTEGVPKRGNHESIISSVGDT